MTEQYWHNTKEDPDGKRRRQAEFLIFKNLDLTYIPGIAVSSETIQTHAEALLRDTNWKQHIMLIMLKKAWYY